jgi:hypothetical protein
MIEILWLCYLLYLRVSSQSRQVTWEFLNPHVPALEVFCCTSHFHPKTHPVLPSKKQNVLV